MQTNLEEQKEDLISLIEWYRDDYYAPSMKDYCNDIINTVKKIADEKTLDAYYQLVDGWFDGTPDF